MLFVKLDKLKPGMRLARPIYNKDGVLLYERNSKLTSQGIVSIKAFGLIGLFILEPAEPVPPMTPDDIIFERFQTMTVFSLREELTKIMEKKRSPRLNNIVNNIIKRYGHLDHKITIIQNLRSTEDYLYKHSLNVAILSALMMHILNMKVEEQVETIIAALVHEIGKLMIPKNITDRNPLAEMESEVVMSYEAAGYEIIDKVFSSEPNIKRICIQTQKALESFRVEGVVNSRVKLVQGAKVMMVAETFDTMTAMRLEEAPVSEVTAVKYLLAHPDLYDPVVVDALIQSIKILVPGVSIELSTGDKAIVILNNDLDIFRPVVLGFKNNNIMDLGDKKTYGDIEVVDIMKTMDNRNIMDIKTLQKHGFMLSEPMDAAYHKGIEEESAEEYIPGQFF